MAGEHSEMTLKGFVSTGICDDCLIEELERRGIDQADWWEKEISVWQELPEQPIIQFGSYENSQRVCLEHLRKYIEMLEQPEIDNEDH
jgi:hypothetical protein